MINQTDMPPTDAVQTRMKVINPAEGQSFDVAGAHLLWKVLGEDTGFAFTMSEQSLHPGEGVPPHSHPYAEVFRILSGTVLFTSHEAGVGRTMRCETGTTVILPANCVHSFTNDTNETAQLLGVSSFLHQLFFDAVAAEDRRHPFANRPPEQQMAHIARIGSRLQMNFMPG